MGKQSAFAKAVQREVDIQLRLYGRNRMQLAEDAAFMAARIKEIVGEDNFSPDKVLPDTPENKHSRKFLNGNV